jgi:hypothetical protein
MYDMYHWDGDGAPEADAPVRSDQSEAVPFLEGAPFPRRTAPVPPGLESMNMNSALQFALDRRDNGGDAAGRRRRSTSPGDDPWNPEGLRHVFD